MTDHDDFATRPARTALLRVRVTPDANKRFADLCKSLDVSVSDAVREALYDWSVKNKPATKEKS